jgi:hypothetical protein
MPEKKQQTPSVLTEKHKLLRRKLFKFGFECEFVYDSSKISLENLSAEFRRINRNIFCDDDGSIDPNRGDQHGRSIEVKTPPLQSDQAFLLLEKVFAVINKYGYTNSTCGLHVNFSPNKTKHYRSINPFSFSKAKLWARIRKDFKRASNTFCVDPKNFGLKKMTALDWFHALQDGQELLYPEHYHVVNFENYYKRRGRDSRIEVRAFGNQDYQKRLSEVVDYSEEILKTFLKHCSRKKIGFVPA